MAKKSQASSTLKILFIGNSFTARNDLPGLIAQIAEAQGKKLEHRLISAGGASLRTHWNAGAALKAMQEVAYDYVALQEQSTLPIKNPERTAENIALFDDAIKKVGAKTVLYMTWARAFAPETQKSLSDAYTSIGKDRGALVVPAGLAWEKFRQKHAEPDLYDQDMSHPSLAGSYLAACAFFAVLFRQDPSGTDEAASSLSPQDRTLLQKTAWAVCKKLVN